MGNGRESVRERALARMKVLAGGSAVAVVAACGYSVVDPLPTPVTCFTAPQPTATAKVVPAPDGKEVAGAVFVEVTFSSLTEKNPTTLGPATANVSAGNQAALDVRVSEAIDKGYRVVLVVPINVTRFTVFVASKCAVDQGDGKLIASVVFEDVVGQKLSVSVGAH